MARPRAKNFCFTDFCDDTVDFLQSNEDECQYFIYQKEICPKTGNEHWQGYVQWKERKYLTWLKSNVSAIAHWEIAKGGPQSNIDYCSKDESRVDDEGTTVFGVPMFAGKRSDILRMRDEIEKGATIRELVWECDDGVARTTLRCSRAAQLAIETFKSYSGLKFDPQIKVICIWGEPGVGKTSAVTQGFGAENCYEVAQMDAGKLWIDGYYGQKVVIIDNFDDATPRKTMLRICDKYHRQYPIKGGFAYLDHKILVVTSNRDPHWWYGNDPAILRRFTKIFNIPNDNDQLGEFIEENECALES